MQLRWIAIGVVCFSAALLSACGGAAGDASLSSREASALSSKESDRGYSSAKGDDGKDHDKDDCDCDDDDSKSKSKSKDDDKKPECKDDDHDRDHDKSKDKDKSRHYMSVSSSMNMASKSKDKSKDDDRDDDDSCKVTVCHRPPGNRCNEHTIRVGKSAVSAHVAHGDYPGSCDPVDPPPPPPPPPPPNSCDASLCPQPTDPNAAAICDAAGQCSSMCIPPTTLVGGLCVVGAG
jgi:hypothetical protein